MGLVKSPLCSLDNCVLVTVMKRDGCLKQGRYCRIETDINGDFYSGRSKKERVGLYDGDRLVDVDRASMMRGKYVDEENLLHEECREGLRLCKSSSLVPNQYGAGGVSRDGDGCPKTLSAL